MASDRLCRTTRSRFKIRLRVSFESGKLADYTLLCQSRPRQILPPFVAKLAALPTAQVEDGPAIVKCTLALSNSKRLWKQEGLTALLSDSAPRDFSTKTANTSFSIDTRNRYHEPASLPKGRLIRSGNTIGSWSYNAPVITTDGIYCATIGITWSGRFF